MLVRRLKSVEDTLVRRVKRVEDMLVRRVTEWKIPW